MEKLFKKPIVICVMALICCALWGSAFPCVKIGYELLQIKRQEPDLLQDTDFSEQEYLRF